MMSQARGFFSRLRGNTPSESSNTTEIDEVVVEKPLSLELFKAELADLGYDFEVFVDTNGKIYRFRRISPKNGREDGDVW